jgi:CRISPR system Cascade subunit CasC
MVMETRFLQIHSLTSYPAALLNRDDAGFAKKIPFGGAVRTRISSQCQKRHWRSFNDEHSLNELNQPGTVRSRNTFEVLIVEELVKEKLPQALVRVGAVKLMELVLGKSQKAKKAASKQSEKEKKQEEEGAGLQTSQLTVLGRPEIDYMKKLVRAAVEGGGDEKQVEEKLLLVVDKEAKKNFQSMKLAAGLDAALFGRMVTSDILARCDAAVHVAHAFTVHEQFVEPDYFSALDDLLRGEEGTELGSAHINTTELTSGLFYGYVAVDVRHLVSNLEGCRPEEAKQADRELTSNVIGRLIHLIATVSPGAKLGSTAPYSHASFVLVESGGSQPRTLANAFLKPVHPQSDLLGNTYRALGRFIEEENGMYGARFQSMAAGVGPLKPVLDVLGMGKSSSLNDVADWAAENIRRR